MKHYTIGAYFNEELTEVLLILKTHPEWQKNKYNLPGGKVEEGESSADCVIREFNEECGIITEYIDWKYIGSIVNSGVFDVEIFTSIRKLSHGEIKSLTEEQVSWFSVNDLPKNVISNLNWLVPFILEYHKPKHDEGYLVKGTFEYI